MTRRVDPSRRGGISFVALACLAVVATLALAVVRGTVIGRGALRSERAARQVECLLDAAAAWAEARLEAGLDPSGTVDVPAAEIVGTADASVTIAATPAAAGTWRLRLSAAYPRLGPHLVRRTRTLTVVTTRPPQETVP